MKETSEGYKKACEVASFLASDKELSEKAHGILTSADLDEKSFVELLFETEEVKESCSLQDAIHRCEYYVDRGETDVSARLDNSLEGYRSIREEYQYYIDQNNR